MSAVSDAKTGLGSVAIELPFVEHRTERRAIDGPADLARLHPLNINRHGVSPAIAKLRSERGWVRWQRVG